MVAAAADRVHDRIADGAILPPSPRRNRQFGREILWFGQGGGYAGSIEINSCNFAGNRRM